MKKARLASSCRCWCLVLLVLVAATSVAAQQGRIVQEKLRGASLGNIVTGDSPERTITVYLPPSYDTAPQKRYPVVYILPGIQDNEEQWIRPWRQGDEWGTIQDVMDRSIAENRTGEMILVVSEQRTQMGGSFYTNSAASGNWEDFTVKDLVGYIDGRYRTLARAESRGIMGHSMGGYGAIKLAMKHPDVFSVAYGMNPAVLGWAGDLGPENPGFAGALRATPENLRSFGFYTAAVLCVGQAFSPNPAKPPFFVDLPFEMRDGTMQPVEPAFSRWEENMPLYMVKQYRANLMELRGLQFDSGVSDEFTHIPVTSRALSIRLTSLGVPHIFEEYNGDHRNRLWGRQGRISIIIFPYFSRLLEKQ
ncbi:MAG: alpha/beta hydrolase [Candidatus Acidiferrales bacterium]